MPSRAARYATVIALLLMPFSALAAERLKPDQSIYLDEKGNGLKSPEGVACNDKGALVVADTGNGRLLRYTLEEGGVKGGAEIKLTQLPSPLRLHLDGKGGVRVLDGKQRRIVNLNPDGTFAGYLQPDGVPAPTAIVPRSFALDGGGSLYLLDVAAERVLVLDPAGKYQRQLPFPKPAGFFSDVVVNAAGDIFILDSVNSQIYVAKKDAAGFVPLGKSLKEYVEFPTVLVSDSRSGFYLVDQDGGTIVALGGDGGFLGRLAGTGRKEGQLSYPGQICIGKNIMAVADRNNSRVQIFDIIR